jgi:hypothetical protein
MEQTTNGGKYFREDQSFSPNNSLPQYAAMCPALRTTVSGSLSLTGSFESVANRQFAVVDLVCPLAKYLCPDLIASPVLERDLLLLQLRPIDPTTTWADLALHLKRLSAIHKKWYTTSQRIPTIGVELIREAVA